MDKNSDTFPSLDSPGAVTTLYAYEGGPARNGLLAAMALQLAADPEQGPVLVIDWDLESPALHQYLGTTNHDAGGRRASSPSRPAWSNISAPCATRSRAAPRARPAPARPRNPWPIPCSTPSTGAPTSRAPTAAIRST